LLFGSQQFHFLGTAAEAWPAWAWPVLVVVLGLVAWFMAKASSTTSRPRRAVAGMAITAVSFASAAFLVPMSPWRESLVNPRIEAADLPWAVWLLGVVVLWAVVALLVRFGLRSAVSVAGWMGRQLGVTLGLWIALVVLATANAQQGSLLTTLFYVIGGVTSSSRLASAWHCSAPSRSRGATSFGWPSSCR
jgi:hypothetical protein